MNIEFESESVFGDNDKYIKTKIKMYGDTNFMVKEYQKKKLHVNICHW